MGEDPKPPPEDAARDDVERMPAPARGDEEVEGAAGEEADQAAAVSPELGRANR